MIKVKRVQSMLTAGLVLATVLVGGCGNGGNAGNGSNAAADGSAAPDGTESPVGAATRTVSTVKGDVEIPADPERVVSGYYHGTLLALGMEPIGASKEWWMGSPFLKEQESRIADIGSPASTEKVLELEPDLIVINDLLADQYDALSKIAPTVLVPYDSIKNIRDEVRVFGELLGKTQEANAWLADYEDKAAQARDRLKDIVQPGMKALLLELDGKTIAALGDNYGRGGEVIYNALRFEAPEWIQENVIDSGTQYLEISMESLPEIAAEVDYIFLSVYSETTEAQIKDFTESSVWKGIPAVKNGNLISLDYKTYFYFDPVTTVGQIDTLAETLLER